MTKPRTLEEIARSVVSSIRAGSNPERFDCRTIEAALREAADAARREEREECIEVVRLEAASWPELGAAILFKIQGLLDARSRAEEPKKP